MSAASVPAWVDDAVCASVDPELFFPSRARADLARQARSVCASCEVSAECLEYALDYELGAMGTATSYPSGIYGGLTARERIPLLRQRRALTAMPSPLRPSPGAVTPHEGGDTTTTERTDR